MNVDIEQIRKKLCDALCAEVTLHPKGEGMILVETPFYFPDGDPYQIYIEELPTGILRVSDMGHTMMHLSYENDIDKFRKGTRGEIFDRILNEMDIEEEEGRLHIDSRVEDLGNNLFKLGQALTKINDLTFLNRVRVQATFYEDLQEELYRHIPAEKIHSDYVYEGIENAADYPIDYYIEGKYDPLYVFGIPTRDKARLTTIVLERLLRSDADFESILIFADQSSIPRPDLSRLSNVGGEMIASLDAEESLQRKLLKRVANGKG